MAPGRGLSLLVRLDPGAYHARPAGWRCNRRGALCHAATPAPALATPTLEREDKAYICIKIVRRQHLWDQSGDLNNCPPLKLFHVLSGNGFSFLDTEGPLRWPPVGRFALFEN